MLKVYVKKWNRQKESWQKLLIEILKKDYQIKNCPEILRDEFGKPYFREDCGVQFNVSHSGEYLAIAVSENPVGIDIQKNKEIREGMFRKAVMPQEQVLLTEKERQRDFIRLWTLKESFTKAEGKGLRIPMKDYYFEKEKDRYFVNYDGQRQPWLFNIEETQISDHIVCVCGLEHEVSWKIEQR